jgi:hypothetical protein
MPTGHYEPAGERWLDEDGPNKKPYSVKDDPNLRGMI